MVGKFKFFGGGINPLLIESPDALIWLLAGDETVEGVMREFGVDAETAARWIRWFNWDLTEAEQAQALSNFERVRHDNFTINDLKKLGVSK